MKRYLLPLAALILASLACSLVTGRPAPTPPGEAVQVPSGAPLEPTAPPDLQPTAIPLTEPQPTVADEQPTPAAPGPTLAVQSSPLSGPCANPFYPVVSDRQWVYQSTVEGEAPSIYTVFYTDISADGFTAHQQFPDAAGEVRWECTPDGLISNEYANMTFSQDIGVDYESAQFEGVALPPADEWQVGATWENIFSLQGVIDMEDFEMTTLSIITTTYTITGIEPISLPAGEFAEAYRVESLSNMHMRVQMEGIDMDMPMNITEISSTNWYVREIGLVKSEFAPGNRRGDRRTDRHRTTSMSTQRRLPLLRDDFKEHSGRGYTKGYGRLPHTYTCAQKEYGKIFCGGVSLSLRSRKRNCCGISPWFNSTTLLLPYSRS